MVKEVLCDIIGTELQPSCQVKAVDCKIFEAEMFCQSEHFVCYMMICEHVGRGGGLYFC